MKKFLIFLIILLSACTSKVPKKNLENNFVSFEKMNFENYKLKLEKYSKNKPYPKFGD